MHLTEESHTEFAEFCEKYSRSFLRVRETGELVMIEESNDTDLDVRLSNDVWVHLDDLSDYLDLEATFAGEYYTIGGIPRYVQQSPNTFWRKGLFPPNFCFKTEEGGVRALDGPDMIGVTPCKPPPGEFEGMDEKASQKQVSCWSPVPIPELLFGVEIEAESVSRPLDITEDLPVTPVADGSLKVMGSEFVTDPLSYEQVVDVVPEVLRRIDLQGGEFSYRTSTHVHLNVAQAQPGDLLAIVLASLLFEDQLFEYAGAGRKASNYCIPLRNSFRGMQGIYSISAIQSLSQSSIGLGFSSVKRDLIPHLGLDDDDYKSNLVRRVASNWNKYDCVNLSRFPSIGTIEFRHLGGSENPEHVLGWIEIIKKIWACHVYSGRVDKYFIEFCEKMTGFTASDEAKKRVLTLVNQEEY